jgi:hypothetical protein
MQDSEIRQNVFRLVEKIIEDETPNAIIALLIKKTGVTLLYQKHVKQSHLPKAEFFARRAKPR